MRFYTFTNFYLNAISQGIQPAHCLGELFMKYLDESPAKAVLYEFAKNHKTMICLNGGHYHGVLACAEEVKRLAEALQLPYANFHEDEQSLGGLMTCTGLVVPQHIYEAGLLLRDRCLSTNIEAQEAIDALSSEELELANFLNQFGLAR